MRHRRGVSAGFAWAFAAVVLAVAPISPFASTGQARAQQGGLPSELRQPLLDQFEQPDSLANYTGSVVVVMVVTAKRLRRFRDWEEDLAERFPDLVTLRIADIPEGRPPDEERIRAKLRDRVPPEISILVDLRRDWARCLDLDTSEPNLLIVTAGGVLAARYRGRYREELADRVAVTLREFGLIEADS